MKKSISRKIILMMVSFLFSIFLLMTINKLMVNAQVKNEKIIFNEQQHINLIKILQNKLNELHQISYRLSRLEEIRLFTKQEKGITSLLEDIEILTNVLISGGEYENNIKINIYNQDLFTDKIIYQPSSKEFSSDILELSPQLVMINDVSNHLMKTMQLYYNAQNIKQYKEVISLYKQLESLISRSKETANRAYLQAQESKNQLHKDMDSMIFRYNIYRNLFLILIVMSMLMLLRQMIKQIYQLVDRHEQSKIDLEENNKTIQKILDSLPVGIALANRKQEIQQINKTALKWMNDAKEADYVNEHCGNIFCLEDEERCPITSNNLAVYDIELGLKNKDGIISTVVKSAIPIRLNHQDMILEAFMDISKQKRVEQELLEQKQFNDAVLNSALVGIVVIDALSHKIMSVNEKAKEMIKADEGDIIGSICNNFICPADRGSCPITDLDEQIHNQQKTLITAQKEEIQILKSIKKAEINGREVYVESFIDISDKTKAEEELKKLSMVVQESSNSIVITTINGEIEYVNPAFEQITGYSSEEVLGKNPRILNARNAENTIDYKEMWKTISNGQIWRGEFCNKKKNGSVFWELASITPVKNSRGIITNYIAIKDDITNRKKSELELKVAKENADKANKAKSFFLAKMSHEIRTPMNGIMGMTDIIMQGTDDKELEEKLKVISVSAENLLTIINEILDFSKIEAGQVELENIPFDLKKMLTEVEELLIIKAKAKNLFLKTRISDQLPIYVLGDPTRVKQIIINLVNNAINFTEEGGITIFLEKKRQNLKSQKFILGISVIDTGIGISEEGKKKLFMAFSQTDNSTTRTHGGTGLGLLISKELSHLFSGNIGVDSQLGEGSIFWVEIPTQEASQEHKKNITIKKEELIVKKNLNVLLAEDNKINQKIAVLNLEKLGHQVQIANNGREAVELFMKNRYDLVLMDIQMPEMSGLEATGLIRVHEIRSKKIKKTPIIALTANALTTDKDKYIAAGMNDYLSKPFKLQDLIRVLSQSY